MRTSRALVIAASVAVVASCAARSVLAGPGEEAADRPGSPPSGAGRASAEDGSVSGPDDRTLDARFSALSEPTGTHARVLAGLAFGEGLRFNNPFRLSTQLGQSPESLSLTAPYADLGLAVAFGPPDGVEHGVALRLSLSMRGVAQQVLSASYLLLHRGAGAFMPYGRAGLAVVTAPDPNVGGELAGGAAYFFTGALGISAELVTSLFYGAGTYDVRYAVYPVVSAQVGLVAAFEVLP